MDCETIGPIPSHGLLIANHLSYLDIVLIAALTPVRFVCKSEVKSWPVFGFFARCGGSIFINRTRRTETTRANGELTIALNGGQLSVLFPEGTSTGGTSVLPFKSSLLEPVVGADQLVFVAHISYALAEGKVADDVCYWGDMTLLPHLFKLLGKRGLRARIAFAPITKRPSDRKELAKQLHREVLRLKQSHSL